MKTSQYLVFIAAFCSAIGGFLFGYDTGIISGAIFFIKNDFAADTGLVEWIVSSILIGCTLGALLAGPQADRFGRKNMILITSLFFVLGAFWCYRAQGPIELIFARIFTGIAIGSASFLTPLYISEISPPHIRGALISLNQFFITLGILGSYATAYILAPAQNWRLMLGCAAIPALILFCSMLFLPKSPRWVLKHQGIDAARNVLNKLRKPEEVEAELQEIQSIPHSQSSLRDLFSPRIRPLLWIACGLSFFQQVSGINAVIYYAPTILAMSGYTSTQTALLATFGIGIINCLSTLFAIKYIDHWGRRILLLYGVAGMSLSLFLLGTIFYLPALELYQGPLATFALMIYIFCFAISLGPIFWVINAEIFPIKVRGKGMGLSTFVNWSSNFLVAFTFLSLTQAIDLHGSFWTYASISILAWVFIYIYVPETKGRSLEQIEQDLR